MPRSVLSIRFNDDKSAFAIGLETGFWGEFQRYFHTLTPHTDCALIVLQTSDGKPVMKKGMCCGPTRSVIPNTWETVYDLTHRAELMSGIGLAQMMGISNIIALVGGGVRPKFAGNRVSLPSSMKGTQAFSS